MHDETIQAASGARAHPDNAHQYTILSSSLYSRSSPPNARFDLDEFFARDQTDAHGVMYDEIRLHHSTRARASIPPTPTPYCPFRLSPCTPPGPTHDSISMSSWHVIKLRPTEPCDEAKLSAVHRRASKRVRMSQPSQASHLLPTAFIKGACFQFLGQQRELLFCVQVPYHGPYI
jgi:hypothetical protein